jgi:hypothetical protein
MLKIPLGTTEKVIETWSWIPAAHREFSIVLGAGGSAFSSAHGTLRLSDLYPALRLRLSLAVPARLSLQSVGSHAHSSAPTGTAESLRKKFDGLLLQRNLHYEVSKSAPSVEY